MQKVEKTGEKDVIKGKIEAVDTEGNVLKAGPSTEDTSIGIDIIKDKKIKKLFIRKQ